MTITHNRKRERERGLMLLPLEYWQWQKFPYLHITAPVLIPLSHGHGHTHTQSWQFALRGKLVLNKKNTRVAFHQAKLPFPCEEFSLPQQTSSHRGKRVFALELVQLRGRLTDVEASDHHQMSVKYPNSKRLFTF